MKKLMNPPINLLLEPTKKRLMFQDDRRFLNPPTLQKKGEVITTELTLTLSTRQKICQGPDTTEVAKKKNDHHVRHQISHKKYIPNSRYMTPRKFPAGN